MVWLGCVGCVLTYFDHNRILPVLMHRSYIHILNCMRYKHYSTSNPVDVNGHSIANLFPIITQQLFTTNTHPQTQQLQVARWRINLPLNRSTAKTSTCIVSFFKFSAVKDTHVLIWTYMMISCIHIIGYIRWQYWYDWWACSRRILLLLNATWTLFANTLVYGMWLMLVML